MKRRWICGLNFNLQLINVITKPVYLNRSFIILSIQKTNPTDGNIFIMKSYMKINEFVTVYGLYSYENT